MKMAIMITLLMLTTLIPQTISAAPDDSIIGEPLLSGKEETSTLFGTVPSGKHYKNYYKTWDVIEVTDDTIVLKRNKSNG